jgi:hypothetical protein
LLASDSAKLARSNFAGKRHTGDPAMLIVLFVATFALLSLAFVPALKTGVAGLAQDHHPVGSR